MGTIYKRGRRWWIGYVVGTKQVCESSKSTHRPDAVNLLRLREGETVKGIPMAAQAHRYRFEAAMEAVRADYTRNQRKSLAWVNARIAKHLAVRFAGQRMIDIGTADLLRYADDRLADGAAHATVNKELAILRRGFRLAMRTGHLSACPWVPTLIERNVREGFFEREDFESVRANLSADLQPVVTFAYLTGWRVPSEVLPLEWRRVDLKAGTVRLYGAETKNTQPRVFVLTAALKRLLEAQKATRERIGKELGRLSPLVFTRAGQPIKSFRKAWKTACQHAGCADRIPHDFRRTAVRNLVRAGVAERVAMQMTGHKTRSVFERYNIVSEADLREAARKLDVVEA